MATKIHYLLSSNDARREEKMEVIQDARRRGNLSVRRRHEGITAPQLVEADMWITLGANLLACSAAPFEDDLKIVFLAVGLLSAWKTKRVEQQ